MSNSPGGPSFTASYSGAGCTVGTEVGLGQDSQPCVGIPAKGKKRDPSQPSIRTKGKKKSILPLASQLSSHSLSLFTDCFLICLFVRREGQGLTAASPPRAKRGRGMRGLEDWCENEERGVRKKKSRGGERREYTPAAFLCLFRTEKREELWG